MCGFGLKERQRVKRGMGTEGWTYGIVDYFKGTAVVINVLVLIEFSAAQGHASFPCFP